MERWTQIAKLTTPIDRKAVEKAIRALYQCHSQREYFYEPEFVYYGSPMAMICDKDAIAHDHEGRSGPLHAINRSILDLVYRSKGIWPGVDDSQAEEFVQSIGYNFLAPILGMIGHARDIYTGAWGCTRCIIKQDPILRELLVAQARECHFWMPHMQYARVSQRPTLINMNEEGKWHSDDGVPALQYSDGWTLWAWKGRICPEKYVNKKVTIRAIQKEDNQEFRSILMDRYGLDRYVVDAKLRLLHEDEYGKLYALDDTPWSAKVTLVVNSSCEPDGSFRNYGLKCDTRAMTAHSGVASTFGMVSDNYSPRIQT